MTMEPKYPMELSEVIERARKARACDDVEVFASCASWAEVAAHEYVDEWLRWAVAHGIFPESPAVRKYLAVEQPASAKYQAVVRPALAEYEAVVQPALAVLKGELLAELTGGGE